MANAYLRLTDTGNREANGLRILGLDLYVDGKIIETWMVNSGAPDAQELMTYNDRRSQPGDYRPIPEDVYLVGQLAFQGGKFDWADSWGSGIGDFWAPIDREGGVTNRGAFGFHLDENRSYAPGSAGCVVFPSRAEVERFVKAMRKYDPPKLIVDWGFGTVPKAGSEATTKTVQKTASAKPATTKVPTTDSNIRIWVNANGFVLDLSEPLDAGQYQIYADGKGWPGKAVRKGK